MPGTARKMVSSSIQKKSLFCGIQSQWHGTPKQVLYSAFVHKNINSLNFIYLYIPSVDRNIQDMTQASVTVCAFDRTVSLTLKE